jgi:two-component system, cell cycle response regulator DivK
LTAFAMHHDRGRLLRAGFNGYVPKPIDVRAFPGQVAEYIRAARANTAE